MMNWRRAKLWNLSEGERSVLLALIAVGLFGAGLSFVIVNQLGGRTEIIRPLGLYDFWSILAGAIGAASGLYLAREWFGWPGIKGVAQACMGICVVSFLGAVIGGTIALPVYGTMFGPFSMIMTLVGTPLLAVFWFTTLMSAHLLVAIWRRERDTIFVTSMERAYS